VDICKVIQDNSVIVYWILFFSLVFKNVRKIIHVLIVAELDSCKGEKVQNKSAHAETS